MGRPDKTKTAQAFTLVELIVTIGIVLALGALILPAASQVQGLRDNTICASNLRQVGLGILSYAHDHNGLLPGPLVSGQFAYWPHYSQLSWHLRDYLELDQDISKRGFRDVFMCPAYLRAGRKMANFRPYNVRVYGVNIQVPMEGESRLQQPFGYANSQEPNTFREYRDYPPMRLLALDRICDAEGRPARSTTWAIRDADRVDGRFDGTGLRGNSNLTSPVHGDRRYALFFDFHVEAMKTDRNGNDL